MYQAKKIGTLPKSAQETVGGILLPAGRLIVPSPEFADGTPPTSPVLWATNERIDNVGLLWGKLAAQFPATGLWPVILESLEGDDQRPWLCGELDPGSSTRPEDHDAEEVLTAWWNDVVPEEEEDGEALEVVEPFGRNFPGLAPASPGTPVEPTAPNELALNLEGRLGLVGVTRPADVPAVLGWLGPVNHFEDMGPLSAVLRSWEDRFGAYLVGVGFNTASLGVQRPPSNANHASLVAAEHMAACSDNIYQGLGSIKAYSGELVGHPAWTFWWD